MAIFRRDNPGTPLQSTPETRSVPAKAAAAERSVAGKVTLVARGSRVIGTITGPAEVVIEGEVEGEVDLDSHVQIGSHGKVKGNMKVRSARIAGQLIGNVAGSEVVELTSTGKLEGDVAAPRVVIAEGAFFRGNIEMTRRDSAPRAGAGSALPARPTPTASRQSR